MNWQEFLRLIAIDFVWVIGLMVLLWAVSVWMHDSSIADMKFFRK